MLRFSNRICSFFSMAVPSAPPPLLQPASMTVPPLVSRRIAVLRSEHMDHPGRGQDVEVIGERLPAGFTRCGEGCQLTKPSTLCPEHFQKTQEKIPLGDPGQMFDIHPSTVFQKQRKTPAISISAVCPNMPSRCKGKSSQLLESRDTSRAKVAELQLTEIQNRHRHSRISARTFSSSPLDGGSTTAAPRKSPAKSFSANHSSKSKPSPRRFVRFCILWQYLHIVFVGKNSEKSFCQLFIPSTPP